MTIDPIIIGLAIGLPSSTLGYLGYRRSRQVDKISEQSGVITGTNTAVQQVINGLNALIDNLQQDNQMFRQDLRVLNTRLAAITAERDELKQEVHRLVRAYGSTNDGTNPTTGDTT